MKKSKQDYEGIYRISRSPSRMAKHNQVSWEKLEKFIGSNEGKADFDAMTAVVHDHQHGTQTANYPYQFITYCIRSKWLTRLV